MKRIISILIMLLFLPICINATMTTKCGENATCTYDENTKILSVDGTGETFRTNENLDNKISFDWNSLNIKKVIINEGITMLGYGFLHSNSMEEIVLPNTLSTIENNVFQGCFNLKELILPDSITNLEYSFS